MVNYKNSKIYTIRCHINDDVYVGSTTQPLCKRLAEHKYSYNNNRGGSLYKKITENGSFNNYYIELYENYPCENKEELLKKEGEIMRKISTIQKITINDRISSIAGRTKKEYHNDNKEYINNKHKEYRLNNLEKIREQNKIQDEKRKEKRKEYNKERYEKIKEQINEKAICDHCGCEITKRNLRTHQKTKKCLKKQI